MGQPDAVSAVSKALRRAQGGLKDPNRPIAALLFLGPTGVGKTELTRVGPAARHGTCLVYGICAIARLPQQQQRENKQGACNSSAMQWSSSTCCSASSRPEGLVPQPLGIQGSAGEATQQDVAEVHSRGALSGSAGAGRPVLWQPRCSAALGHERVHGAPLCGQAHRGAARCGQPFAGALASPCKAVLLPCHALAYMLHTKASLCQLIGALPCRISLQKDAVN